MKRLRVGLVGAGLVGQAEHAFYLWEERDRFELVALADASRKVRDAVGARYGIAQLHARADGIVGLDLDAVVVATPDPFHSEAVLAALDAGLHVFCEKPLALTLRECDEIIAARDRAGRIVQVGYMKRFDPAYEHLLTLLPESVASVRAITIEVNDPDQTPFVSHLPMTVGDDVPAELIEAGRSKAAAQAREATGRDLDAAAYRAYVGGFLSSIVHDVNAVHGILARLGQPLPAPLVGASFWAGGAGVELAWQLEGGGRVRGMHLNLPGVADYTERITVYCDDRILELTFPAPYLRHLPTRLVDKRTDGDIGLRVSDYRPSYEEAFRSELRSFHSTVTTGTPLRNPPEEARLDVQALAAAHALAMETRPIV